MIPCIKQRLYTQNIVLIICAFACLDGVTAQGTANKVRFNINAGVSQGICISIAKYSTSNTIQGPHKDASKFQGSNKAKCEIIQRNKCGSSDCGGQFRSRKGCRAFECPTSPGKGTRIFGGEDALPHEFPHQIQIKLYGKHSCGGSLLNERYVISGARYFAETDLSDYSVLAGVHNQYTPSGNEQERKLKKITIHEKYNRLGYTGNHDISVLEVDPPFQLTAAVQPVLMPQPDSEATGDAIVTGWGKADPARADSDILQKLTVPIITNKECSDKYDFNPKVLPIMICAGFLGVEGKDACEKDKGGPLVVKMSNGSYVLVGVFSFGTGCPEVPLPGVYVRVSKYVDWIYKNAGVNISQVTPPISEC